MKRVLLVGLVAIGLSVGGFGSPLARVTGAAPPALEVVNLAAQAQADGTALYRVCVVSPETPIVGYITLSASTSTAGGASSVTTQQVALSESGYDCGLPYSYRLQGVAALSPSGRATTYDFTQVCASTPHHPLCLGRGDNFTGQGGTAVPIIPNCSVDLQVNEDGQVVGPTALLGCRDGQGSLTNGQALPTPTPTPQSACNATSTPLAGATSTATNTPTDTNTPTNTATPTNTPTNTPIPTVPVFPGQPTPTPTLPRTEAVHRMAGANTASHDLAGLDAATTPTPIVLCLATPSATATTAVSPTNTAEPAASPAATATDTPQASAPTATDTPIAPAATATNTAPPAPTATDTPIAPAATATNTAPPAPPATATNTAPPPPAPTATNTSAPPPAPPATNTVAPLVLAPSATATTAPPLPSATPTGTTGFTLAATATPTPSNAPPASPTSNAPPPATIPVRQATPPSRVGHPLATRLRISVAPHTVRPGDTTLVTIRYLRRASLHIVLAYAPHHHLALTRRANAKGILSLRLRVPRVTLRGGHGAATMTVTATSGSSHAKQSVRIALSDLVLSLATAKVRACGQVLTLHIAYFGAAKAQVTVSYLGRSHVQKTVRTGHGGLATSRLKLSYLHLKQRRLTLTLVVNGWHGRTKQTERMRVTVSVPAACLS